MNIEKCEYCKAKDNTAVKVLSNNELELLQKNTLQLHLKEEVEVFKQDSASSNIFYLKEGIVKLTVKGNHRNKIIKIINSPNYIGLASSLGSSIFNFSAITLTKCVVCVTTLETYQNLILQNKYFSLEIIKHLSENELTQYNSCVCLLQQNLNGRLASCLVNFSNNIYKSPKFEINRKDLSDIIGHSRENISRAISQLTKDGIINIDGNYIEIIDSLKLETIAKKG
ncbi:MAG: hypothetical protein A2033_00105 [Bacteroidetes bacterium GWA2_31_9]|nr:MAG: hypothetical protein A2033_00105 [Bacteroidetes bacterium GWA2_31_9]